MEQTQEIKSSSGSVTGCVLMVSGCCIGAGMVGLPAITAMCGFLPSFVALLIAYLFMISTGLLFLEVTLLFPKGSHLLSITEKILGKYGRLTAASLFIFLFFSLIIAYLSGMGELVTTFLSTIFCTSIPQSAGVGLSALFVIFVIYRGAQSIDTVNSIFVIGMAFSFLLLVTFGIHKVSIDNLSRFVLNRQPFLAMPILLVSFGYQNLIPSITTYLDKNKNRIRRSIIIGCSIPLLVYFVWEAIILGSLKPDQATLLGGASSQTLILSTLKDSIVATHITLFIQLFSFFALITSLLTVSLSCFDFLSERFTKINRLSLSCFLIILPLTASLYKPHLFLTGLSIAGGLGAVLLFGVIPILMAWIVRYKSNHPITPLLAGGKPMLLFLLIISLSIFTIELAHQINFFGYAI